MTTTTRLAALISSPAEATVCRSCVRLVEFATPDGFDVVEIPVVGVRHEGEEAGKVFAHCPECGSTDLVDTRSPFEVFVEAVRNYEAVIGDPMLSWIRYDTMVAAREVAQAADADHCSECAGWARRAKADVHWIL